MVIEQCITIIAGSVVLILGATGLVNRTRKGARLSRLLTDLGARLFYVVIGSIIIGLGLFAY
jgi:hypothetical protein